MSTAVEQRADLLAAREAAGLAAELKLLARKGLPLEPGGEWPRLTALASVTAQAGDDTSPDARIEALDWVLRRVLARLKLEGLRDAAKALFGLPPAERRSSLTLRREAAAKVLGKEVHHFRKRLEPKILAEVVHALRWDAAAQSRPWASPPPVRPGRKHRRLPSDIFAWEAAEHEEALTRLWACVYALRAELLAVERQVSMGDAGEATAAADSALWRYGQLQAEARRYQAAYGGTLLPDGNATPHDLTQLAGWIPKISPSENALVADASSATSTHLFMLTVHSISEGEDLLTSWRSQLTDMEETTV
jgi:hypothetical protein